MSARAEGYGTILTKSNRKVSGHTKFQSSSCELPFKCNNAETYIQIILCRTASYVCQEWEHDGVPQASTSWSHCRITPQASIHQTYIMVRKLWTFKTNVWKWYTMCSLQNNTTDLYPPNLYYSKEALKHFETKCTIFTQFFNMFHSFFTMMQVWWMKKWAQFAWLMQNWDTTPAWQPSWPCWQSIGDRIYHEDVL
jgi:hypothetical protein